MSRSARAFSSSWVACVDGVDEESEVVERVYKIPWRMLSAEREVRTR